METSEQLGLCAYWQLEQGNKLELEILEQGRAVVLEFISSQATGNLSYICLYVTIFK